MRRKLMLNVGIRNNQRRQALNDGRILNDRRHGDVRSLNKFNSRYRDDALEKFFQRRHIRLEIWQLLVEKHVLGSEQNTVGTFARVHLHALDNVFQRKRAANLGSRSAKLAAAPAPPRDLDNSEG